MPGAMVIVNAIDSLGNHGQLHSPGVLTKILLAILSVLFISIFFAYFESLFAKVVVLVLVMVVAQPIAYKLFPTGVWLNVALPAMVMGLTELVLDIRELRNPLKDDVGNTDAGDNTHRSFSFLRIIKIGRRRG
jgi:hypothetical protein